MKSKPTYIDNKLLVSNQSIEFEIPIEKIITRGQFIIVLLAPSCGIKSINNLFCLSLTGKKIWQVQYQPETKRICPFLYIDETSSNPSRIVLVDNCDHSVEVETKSGAILSRNIEQW